MNMEQVTAASEKSAQAPERSLLMVDDEENILSALTRVFRREGYRLHRATSGSAGLQILEQHPVDVIISDQRMPEMTGVEFLGLVKDRFPNTVRIVLSGYTDLNSVTEAINKGAVYKFLTKPWEDELLLKNVREAFQHAELERENRRLAAELQRLNEELSGMNRDLERRVAEQTQVVMQNIAMLRVSQDILEHLPVAVLGVDETGLVVVANRVAQELLGTSSTLVGQMLAEVLQPEIGAVISLGEAAQRPFRCASGRVLSVHYVPLRSASVARGGLFTLSEAN